MRIDVEIYYTLCLKQVNFPRWLWVMHHHKKRGRGGSLLWTIAASLNTFAVRANLQIIPVWQSEPRRSATMLWARAVSVQQPASGWQGSVWYEGWGGRGSGADGGTTWKPCIQKKKKKEQWAEWFWRRGKGWGGSPQMERWVAFRRRGYNVSTPCTVLPNKTTGHSTKKRKKNVHS